jgi:hypothetical protein
MMMTTFNSSYYGENVSYLEKYYQSSYKNSKALDEVTQHMDICSSNINILSRTMTFYLTLCVVLGTTVRMAMLMKSETHPASKHHMKTPYN